MIKVDKIFRSLTSRDFSDLALEIFRFQARNNAVYHQFIHHLNIDIATVKTLEDIPFLPIEFFKSYQVVSAKKPFDLLFESSGTTGMTRSKHFVKDKTIYEQSFVAGFKHFFGNPADYNILALLPSYLEQGNSSLVYMTKKLIELTQSNDSDFYLHNQDELAEKIVQLEQQNKKTILLGVSYALLDFTEQFRFNLKNTIVMETGGMKGRKKEMVREELHQTLQKSFGVKSIYSEYGMTELLSQSYSTGKGIFTTPPWQKILIRDTEDPFSYLPTGKTGGINIIDLANIYSCSFIATQDLGKQHTNSNFEIVGRFDQSDVRGCNLLVV